MPEPLTPDQLDQLPAPWRTPLRQFTIALQTAGRAPATIAEYQHFVACLAREVPADPWTLTGSHVRDFLDAQRWAHATRRKAVNALRRFYAHGIAAGHLDRSPMLGIALRADGARRSGPARPIVPPAWRLPLADFQTYLRATGRAASTRDTRRIHLAMLATDFACPWSVTTHDLALWLGRDGIAPETRRARRASVRAFYAWATLAGHMDASPAAPLDAVPTPRALPRPATDIAVAHALARADSRVRLAIMLGALAGLRRAEIAAVHRDDLTGSALLVKGKGSHERSVPLHPELFAALATELARRDNDPAAMPSGWLFPHPLDPARHITPSYLGRLITRALPRGTTPHMLRHRFATQTYAAGRDLLAVQTLLGHSKPETTARYAGIPSDALRTAVAGASLPTYPQK